ncbi:Serine/threonine-protein phosphatase 4 regulatory subunit 1 [Psilocybe cubensis]|uniref:Uncharacterized protein n=2 Tax=Psilocybe cubensis TaxID=181762 RepID=A0A8H7Y0W2_PSICU|nr:Serine/threonine-protein phosphatase 4 regulatory subunit 1 [Psilocybe cubensis]KAH9484240.1 Serine/threonine-protein phosphatase 4 regulatory subunit 1 [Psilocybe cubensis]
MSGPPTHIPLPPPPSWPDNFRIDPDNPHTPFFTPPTSPARPLASPSAYFTPPSSPDLDLPLPPPPPQQPTAPPTPGLPTDDHFPQPVDHALDLALDDDGLSTLEKIYLYSRSKAAFHRVFIAHALPEYLLHVTPQEAVEYVLPLLSGLAMDDDEHVKEALAAELVPIIWWFFTDCQIIPDDPKPEEAYASSSTTVTISVQAFTPILGTLLLSSNPMVGGAARFAVVDLLSRMKKADDRQFGAFQRRHHHPSSDIIHPWEITRTRREDEDEDDDDEAPLATGLFGHRERAMFTQEILQQVVIGMGKLDVDYEPEQEPPVSQGQQHPATSSQFSESNPYFPSLSSQSSNADRHENVSMRSVIDQTTSSAGAQFHTDAQTSSPAGPSSAGTQFSNLHAPSSSHSDPGSPMAVDTNDSDNWDDVDDGEDEQAAVGRLSCMSLMAAVTASGVLSKETQLAFVEEVGRVGRDNVYWVRREASFALGALAKVVPEEVVINSLLPLFDALRWDGVWHVRHSALFALPAILTRLSPAQRRTVALETIVALSADHHPTVRSGVLEALGEVIHTFHEDPDGPPQELIYLFLGRKEDRRVRDGQQELSEESIRAQTPLESFFQDPKRPLICAFNFPAVAVTLGGGRWGELREAYLDIAANTGSGVRRTFAASLGELAKIIGKENAQRDLVDVWWSSIQSDEEEVRTKAIESLHDLLEVLQKEVGKPLVEGLLTAWNEGRLRGWRERELIEKNMVSWVNLIGLDNISLARDLLQKGLEDGVASVREAATLALSEIWDAFASQKGALDTIRSQLQQLAASSNYRRRMTFIACQQTLALTTNQKGELLVSSDAGILDSVANLARDQIEGVRIGAARFAAVTHAALLRHGHTIPRMLEQLVDVLLQDTSHEVRSYVAGLSSGIPPGREHHNSGSTASRGRSVRGRLAQLATFSRPPRRVNSEGSEGETRSGGRYELEADERKSNGLLGVYTGLQAELFQTAGSNASERSVDRLSTLSSPLLPYASAMLNLLQILRYCVFAVFLVANAVITSVAVWNLSTIESSSGLRNAKQTDGLLIFVGTSGLLLILTILFFDLNRKHALIVRVWFELAWVGVYCIFELAAAAALTAQSSSQICDSTQILATTSSSACTSAQVLQAFTWICATLLLGYLIFLSILTIVKKRDDPTILHCAVSRFPIVANQSIKDNDGVRNLSPEYQYPRFVGGNAAPIIAAPIPRLPPTHREPILSYNSGLSYRSGLGLEYEIEHYQSPETVFHAATSEEGGISRQSALPLSLVPAPAPVAVRDTRVIEPEIQRNPPPISQQTQQKPPPPQHLLPQHLHLSSSSPFYHSSVQSAIKTTEPQAPAPARVEQQIRRLPPSPPPLGDWPRLDATSRPRAKRKPLPQPDSTEHHDNVTSSVQQPPPQQPLIEHHIQPGTRHQPLPHPPQPHPQPQPQPLPQVPTHSRPLPRAKRTPSTTYTLDARALTAALKPLEVSQSMRSKPSRPSGPRRKSDSIDDGRPPQ